MRNCRRNRTAVYLPFAQSGGRLLFHLYSRLYERTSLIVSTVETGNDS
jgi:hypothetical protein